jgi:hypothetical protein
MSIAPHAHTNKEQGGGTKAMENQSHKGNYKGTTAMKAKNQDMAFVNDTIEDAKSVTNFSSKNKKTD